MKSSRDLDYMEHADGELETNLDDDGRAKVSAVQELSELVRGRLERSADDVPDARFAQMWSQIDKSIDAAPAARASESTPGVWRRISRWFDRYRGYVLTGAVSAGAVAALALVLRGPSRTSSLGDNPIPVMPVVHRPAEIEELDTPGGNGSVFNVQDEDGSTTVIWVTPEDTVEGI